MSGIPPARSLTSATPAPLSMISSPLMLSGLMGLPFRETKVTSIYRFVFMDETDIVPPLTGLEMLAVGAGFGSVPSAFLTTRLKFSVSAAFTFPSLSYQVLPRKLTSTSPTWGKVPVMLYR